MRLHEGIPVSHLHSMVGLTAAGSTAKAIQRHRMGHTPRPVWLDPAFAMAPTSVHRPASTTHKMPDTVRALAAFRTGFCTQWVCQHEKQAIPMTMVPGNKHDPDYERPINSRYVDPCEVIWLATAARLGLHIRRSPLVFSATDGTGRLQLSTRDDLDEDDCLAQMLLHEICHWCTNGVETYGDRDWGFALDGPTDHREHSALRLQAWLADQVGLRSMFGPTGVYRQYYDRIPVDPCAVIDDSDWETAVVNHAKEAIARMQLKPWHPHVLQAMKATVRLREVVGPFLGEYASEVGDDVLPSLWGT